MNAASSSDKNYQAPLLDSHKSIIVAATHLFLSVLDNKIDLKKANFALRALLLAQKSVIAIEKSKQASKAPKGNDVSEKDLVDGKKLTEMNDQMDGREAMDGKDVVETGRPRPVQTAPLNRSTGDSPAVAQATSPASPQPKRGVWDPEGCLAQYAKAE